MLRDKIEKLIEDLVKQEVELEHPSVSSHGDFSTNVALKAKINPDEIIEKLKDNYLFEKVEKAGPGFINVYLSKKALNEELTEILKKGNNYGQLEIGKNKKVQVEFISANPTGPLTVGNARGGPYGDVLANIFKKAGYDVKKAYYLNDFGQQIRELGDEDGEYQGNKINILREQAQEKLKTKDFFEVGQELANQIFEDILKKTTDRMNIKYDEWIRESDLHKKVKIDKILDLLRDKKLLYKKEEAEWFKSSDFGDDRDRVMVKKDGNKTYLAGDIALHNDKFKKFDKVINVWGADHHGDIPGLMAGVEAIGHKEN